MKMSLTSCCHIKTTFNTVTSVFIKWPLPPRLNSSFMPLRRLYGLLFLAKCKRKMHFWKASGGTKSLLCVLRFDINQSKKGAPVFASFCGWYQSSSLLPWYLVACFFFFWGGGLKKPELPKRPKTLKMPDTYARPYASGLVSFFVCFSGKMIAQ